MLILIGNYNGKKITQKHIFKETTRELRWYTIRYLFNSKGGSNGGMKNKRDIKYTEKQKVTWINYLSVIILKINKYSN